MPFSASLTLQILTALLAAYSTFSVFYRLFLHPLSRFPGPTLAAITDAYAGWYEVIQKGRILDQLEILHEKYGPVVRIGPGKLHFNDPRAFDDIYKSLKLTKAPYFYDATHEQNSSWATTDPIFNRERREVLRPLFSRQGILKLEHVIQSVVDRLLMTLSRTDPSDPINLHHAFMSASFELITTYCFAKSHKAVDDPHFSHPIILALDGIDFYLVFFATTYIGPILELLVFGLPLWLAGLMSSKAKAMQEHFRVIAKQVEEVIEDREMLESADHETVFHHLLMPLEKRGGTTPTKKSLLDEAGVLVAAGTETVANACTTIVFHILRNGDIEAKLREELEKAWPDVTAPMPLENLERLPYLTAIIKEGLRLSHGVVTPLPRVAHETTNIAGIQIPAGTIVSMGQTFVHLNPDLFESPLSFKPERWLDGTASDKNLVAFSRGPRLCLGMYLGWAELYLIVGNIFRRLDFTLPEERPNSLEYHALLTAHYKGNPLQVRVNRHKANVDFTSITSPRRSCANRECELGQG